MDLRSQQYNTYEEKEKKKQACQLTKLTYV